MFGRKRRKARREQEAEEARRAGGAHLRTLDDEQPDGSEREQPAPDEPVTAPSSMPLAEPEPPPEEAPPARTGPEVGTVEEKPSPAPLRSLLTDGERLGFEPELAIPEDAADDDRS